MLLNCDVGEDSWESLALARRPNQSIPKEISPGCSLLWPPDVKSWFTGKDPDAGKDWRQEEKQMTEDEMVRWHHWINGHESEQTPRVGDGQGGLVCCGLWGRRVGHDWATELNWTVSIWRINKRKLWVFLVAHNADWNQIGKALHF